MYIERGCWRKMLEKEKPEARESPRWDSPLCWEVLDALTYWLTRDYRFYLFNTLQILFINKTNTVRRMYSSSVVWLLFPVKF